MKTVLDTPFSIRQYSLTLKEPNRLSPVPGPMIATAECLNPDAAVLTVCQGLSDTDNDSLTECSAAPECMALFETQTIKDGLVFDLGGTYDLASIAVWNYNKPAYTDLGAAKATVSVYTESSGWKVLVKNAELFEAEGTADYDEPSLLTFDPLKVQKVRFEDLVCFNQDSKQIGLSKIQFFSPLGPAACNPCPAENAQIPFAGLDKLSWTGGKNSLVHAVYLAEVPNEPQLLGKITGSSSVNIEGLKPQTAYYWRIDEVQQDGTTTKGLQWTFTTSDAIKAHWALDGNADDSNGTFNGIIKGSPEWLDGSIGKAVKLDGKSDYIEIPPLNTSFDSAAVCFWLRLNDETQPGGLFFCGSEDNVLGFHLLSNLRLGYNWNNTQSSRSWNSRLNVPRNQWVFVALSVEPSGAAMYMWDGKELKTAKNKVLHKANRIAGPIRIGRGPSNNGRFTNGAFDEVRFFTCALTEDQVKKLCSNEPISFGSDIRLVNAKLVTDDQPLAEIAKQPKQPDASSGKRFNPAALAVIAVVVLAMIGVTAFKKNK